FGEATLRRQAVSALGTHGLMALAILDKYASDPNFREVLRTYGAAVIPPIAQADAGPETLAYPQGKTRRSFKESLALSALVAAEAIRSEVKGAVRQGAKSLGRELAETGSESAGEALARQQAGNGLELATSEGTAAVSTRLARWWTVREAGGLYQVLRRIPEA